MLITIVLWTYIFAVSIIIGQFGYFLFEQLLKKKVNTSVCASFVSGTVLLTVYASYFSSINKVGLAAHIVLLIVTIVSLIFVRKQLFMLIKEEIRNILNWKGIVYLGIVFVCAFFTSRGTQHTDTSLYHAMAIHWIEEYGVVKGLGNLMSNFAYNSLWLCYSALFSMKFLTGVSFHVINGLLMTVFMIFAVDGLWDFRKHKHHMTDAVRFAFIFYILIYCVVAQSPATDQPANYIVMYIVLRWLELVENKKDSVDEKALLCVLAVYTLTLKLSAGLIVLLVVSPLITLIKRKDVKSIIIYLCMGLITILPYFIRNVILSGWLIYPFAGIDLFNFEWKVPVEVVKAESRVVTLYARHTLSLDGEYPSIKDWFPIWWDETFSYERSLFIAQIVGAFAMLASVIKQLVSKVKINWDLQLLNVVLIICFLFWFIEGPSMRFGMGYLLVIPMVALSEIHLEDKVTLYRLVAAACVVAILTCMAPLWNHYMMDTLLFVKHNLTENYYIMPKDYDEMDKEEFEVDGVTFYTGDWLSYYSFPGAGHKDHFALMGKTIKDGIKYRN